MILCLKNGLKEYNCDGVCVIIRKYDELKEMVKAFSNKKFNLLIIQSKGGLGKSQMVKEYVNDTVFFRGHATPLSIFLKLSDYSASLCIFDDVDELIKNKGNVSLLKQLTETTKYKTVQYNTTSQVLNDKPQSFISQNRVCLLVNDIKRVGKNMKALLTRGFYVSFEPSNEEVFKELEKFAKDTEILSFLGLHLKDLKGFNFRVYVRCLELKSAFLDWKKWVLEEFCRSTDDIVLDLIKDLPVKERDEVWVRETGKSIRTLRRRLK